MHSYLFGIIVLAAMWLAFQNADETRPEASCVALYTAPLSDRIANYEIKVKLDHNTHTAAGKERITWVNTSPDTIDFVRMYMYMNAFKSNQSSFIKGAGGQVFGQDLANRPPEEWGWVDALNIRQADQLLESRYVHPDDGNTSDETVLEVDLFSAILPGDTLVMDMDMVSKLPKTIARSGYSRNDFHLFVHWYPKMGVYEKNEQGIWGWNCHQFLRQMEFYGDFGSYDIEITASDHLLLGASGCLVSQTENGDGTITYLWEADDVIDFAWTAYADFVRYTDQWKHVEIELLSPPHHESLVPRLLGAVKHSLEYMEAHVGEYPYPKITVMDPPAHATRNGFMEYPTFITGGSFYKFPKGLKTLESLIVHEFAHQYFMAMLANNEKEEAWLDEGFVTFYEDEIMEHYYKKGASLIDIVGYKVGNYDLTRNEYTSMENKRVSPITKPSYQIRERYKGIVYSKTALTLRTLQAQLGVDLFDKMMRTYYDQHRFTHPRKSDFLNIVRDVIAEDRSPEFLQMIMNFLDQALDGTEVCDFQATQISVEPKSNAVGWFNGAFKKEGASSLYINSARIHRLGDFIMPVEILFTFDDGTTILKEWDAIDNSILYEFELPQRLTAVHIDPQKKILLDIDFNNNSYLTQPNKSGVMKYAARSIFWLQNVLQTASFLM